MRSQGPPRLVRRLIRGLLRLFPEDVPGVDREDMEETILDRFRAEEARTGSLSTTLMLRELWYLFTEGLRERLETGSAPDLFAGLAYDLRFVIRSFLKHRAFTVGAIAMLALGIGVNAATFSLARGTAGVVDRFADPGRLVFVWRVERQWDEGRWSAPGYRELEEQATAFEETGAYRGANRYLAGDGEPLRTIETLTTPNLLPMLGLEAALGRLYGPGDLDPSAPDVVVLTHRLWMDRYGGEADVLGRTLHLDDAPHTIIGVLAEKAEFELLWRGSGVFTPLPLDAEEADWSTRTLGVMARVAEGASIEQASAQVAAISGRLAEAHPDTHGEVGARVEAFEAFFFSTEDRIIFVGLQAAVIAILLIACINLANVLMAKGADRQGEVAIRLAMGASRSRMIRHLLSESLLLALAGGVAGVLLGNWGIHLLLASLSGTPFLPEEVGLNGALLTFSLLTAVGAALAFGLTPAILATRTSLGAGVREARAGASSGIGRKRLRSGLLVTQLALTVPLVATSAISYLNLRNLRNTDFGFPVEALLTARVELPTYRYPAELQADFYREAIDAVRAAPGVVAASAGMSVPIGAGSMTAWGPFLVEGREDQEDRGRGPRGYRSVAPGYFEALGVPFRGGRSITDADGVNGPPVAVVNEALARLYWPGENAVGKRLLPDPEAMPDGQGPDSDRALPVTIVGVVSDFGASFHGEPPAPMVYLPQAQRPTPDLLLVVRTAGDPLGVIAGVREAIRRVDANVPVSAFTTGTGMVDRWLQESRSTGVALGVLAVLAMGMAVIGLYGLVAYSVTQRTFELGIRMVLGADRWAVRMTVMRSFLVLAGIGLSIGVGVAVGLGMVARSILVTLQVSFLPTALGLTAVLLGVVLLASYLPARRATLIEPVVALKAE